MEIESNLDTVIVGAGQAGLAASAFLQQAGLRHVVLERGRIGETWLSQRWESFQLNTPNSMNALPGLPYDGSQPDGFWRSDELVGYFQRYVDQLQLPVRTGVNVLSVEQDQNAEGFSVKTRNDGHMQTLHSRTIVVASGIQNAPLFPSQSSQIPREITQLHTSSYRNATLLPEGAVVVVGSAQSGVQIVEDLLIGGRTVYLCTGKAGRVPRRYRGRDVTSWMVDLRQMDASYSSLADKSATRASSVQVSGVGRYGHTLSLQSLARRGVVILGRLLDVQAGELILGDEAAAHVRFAVQVSQRMKDDIDALLAQAGKPLPPLEDDPADALDPRAECASPLRRLNLRTARISTLIWATGFTGDFNWLHLPVFDAQGAPVHQGGISPVRGLYFLGFPWLTSRKSGIIYGVGEDARSVAAAISEQFAQEHTLEHHPNTQAHAAFTDRTGFAQDA